MGSYVPRMATWLLTLLIVSASLVLPATSQPAQAAPSDTPTPSLPTMSRSGRWAPGCSTGPTTAMPTNLTRLPC
ncbi:MAG: hypothetical protein R3E79_00380 [Caldilineaceae bacterium]